MIWIAAALALQAPIAFKSAHPGMPIAEFRELRPTPPDRECRNCTGTESGFEDVNVWCSGDPIPAQSSAADFRAAVSPSFEGAVSCTFFGWVTYENGPRTAEPFSLSLAGLPQTRTSYSFDPGLSGSPLVEIRSAFRSGNYEDVLNDISALYGAPEFERAAYQNAFGASLIGETATWTQGGTILQLEQYSGTRTHGSLRLWAPALLPNSSPHDPDF